MNWGREALDLYEKNLNKVGKIEYRGEFPYTLLPTFHSTATAQITVTIDEEGNFLHGEQVPANDKFTIIPVTEKSGSRTSGKEAHPLCDNLRYLAGDYPLYVADDGSCFEIYMEQLKKWYESEFCHDKVRAIYYYLQKKSLMHDLIEQKVLKQNEDGTLAEKETIQGIDQSKAFVRFIVRSLSNPLTETVDECWKDKTLWEKYQQYQRSMEGEKGLCYLSGKRESISYLQPKKIRNEGDGAKLISSNDKDNFTYRGRFTTKEEAFAIGNETSQKVHNALKWIIRRQGGTYDTMVFVTWETAEDSAGELEVQWDSDTEHIISEFDEWDTGLEDPEFDTNAIGADGTRWNKQKLIQEFGFPVLSKEIARKIELLQNPTPNNKTIRHAIVTGETGEYGGFQKHSKMKLAQKWLEKFGGLENEEEGVNYQIAPFKVSSKCCYYLKEKPCSDWAKEHNCVPYLGLMASEGGRREKSLMLNGCNYFGKGTIRSAPFAIFNRQDLLQLALDLKVPVPEIYGSILKDEDGHLYTSGEQRTGCSMCGFGIQLEKRPHRFDRLRERNYKEWDFWMNRCCFDENGTPYGWGKVLDYLGIGWRDIPDPHNRKK